MTMAQPVQPASMPKAIAAHGIKPRASGRPWTYYVLCGVFVFYVLALYGPMICIYVLSFQDVRGGLVFPMKGISLHWFIDLFTQVRTGDVKGAFDRSVKLAVIVTILTVALSFLAGLAFRRRFTGDNIVFYLMIGSLVAPGLVLGLGVGLLLHVIGVEGSWYTSAIGAQLSWTLPFGVLVMFAVMSRFDSAGRKRPTTWALHAGRPYGWSWCRYWRPA
jgi:putative spermidine/putrescine transport system permease protein